MEQAAGHLTTEAVPAADSLRLLRTRTDELLAKGQLASHDHTIATLWDVSHTSLRRASPAGDQLLHLCAFLAPEPIPLTLFTTHPDLLPTT